MAKTYIFHVLVNFEIMVYFDSMSSFTLMQGCQGYGPRAGPGPTVRHIRPAGDKGRIYFFILFFSNFSNLIFFKFFKFNFFQIFQILFFSNFRWNPSVGLLLLPASAAAAPVVLIEMSLSTD